MQTAKTISEVRIAVRNAQAAGKRIGCVPTMGALHASHLSLIEKARQDSDFVVVTIFVNPTQFGPSEDLSKYPRPLQRDLKLCEQAGADLVFHPDVPTIYQKEPQITVSVGDLATRWEGASRPGHFDGVATVVTKLFNIVGPDVAFFGQKDFQQLSIIRAICKDLDFPIEIISCPTIREEDGLALSSRNAYLSSASRKSSTVLYQALCLAEELTQRDEFTLEQIRHKMHSLLLSQPGVEPVYATIVDTERLEELEQRQTKIVAIIAAKLGQTRLIDNMIIRL